MFKFCSVLDIESFEFIKQFQPEMIKLREENMGNYKKIWKIWLSWVKLPLVGDHCLEEPYMWKIQWTRFEKATLLKCIMNAISFMSSGITSANDRLDKVNIYLLVLIKHKHVFW